MAAAFPVGLPAKTNLAMIQPTIPGWRAETLGDDIAWMRFGKDGRLYAVNPGSASSAWPRHKLEFNPNAMKTIAAGLRLHQRRADRRRGRLVGEPRR